MQILENLQETEPTPSDYMNVFKRNGTTVRICLSEYFFLINDMLQYDDPDFADEILDMYDWQTAINFDETKYTPRSKYKIAKYQVLCNSHQFLLSDDSTEGSDFEEFEDDFDEFLEEAKQQLQSSQ